MTLKRLALCFALLLAFLAVEVGTANADLLTDIKKGARKVGRAIGEGVDDAGDAIGRGARKLGRDMERGYCRLAEDRNCRVNSSVGRDKKGTYAYDPKNPKKKYRGDESDPQTTDRDKQLSKFAAYVKTKELTPSEIEDRDVHKFRRFLLPNAKLGEGYPEKEKLVPPTKSGEIRGDGGFLADRLDKTKPRFYGGTDYPTKPGEPVYATVDGWVEMRKDPRKEFQGLILRNTDGYRVSIYFVELTPEIDKALKDKSRFEVKAGETVLGKAQDLHPAYPPEVPDHLHVIMSDPKGNPIDPSGKILLERAPKSVSEKLPVKKAPEAAAKP